jgi:hypothetical protein
MPLGKAIRHFSKKVVVELLKNASENTFGYPDALITLIVKTVIIEIIFWSK